jgi:hypothetical protein
MPGGRQNAGPMGEHDISGDPIGIGGPGIRLQKKIGGGGGANPTLSVAAKQTEIL